MSVDILPSRKNWLDWRRTGIGSSDAPIIAGVSQYPDQNRVRLWLEKTNQITRDDNEAPPQMWGHLFEDAIAYRVSQRLGLQYAHSQPCFQSDERPWQRATLDRLTKDDRIVELKSVNFKKALTIGDDDELDTLPEPWVIQAQHQMAVTGLDLVIFGVFVSTFEDVRIFNVERNNELIDSLNEVEAEFWNAVETKTPPLALDVRDSEALVKHLGVKEGQVELDADIESVVDQYNEIRETINFLEAQKDSARARIIDALGGVSLGALPDGRIVKCSVSDVPEGTSIRKAHKRINLSFRNPRRI